MGFVDRGGGREAKGSSLRRSKKNPGAATTRNKGAHKNYTTPATRATPTPPPACVPLLRALAAAAGTAPPAEGTVAAASCGAVERAVGLAREALTQGGGAATALHVDAAVALLSRKLEEDQEGIFRRAVEEGQLAAMVCWCGEVERQSLLLDACVQHNKLHRGAGAEAGGGGAGKQQRTATAIPATAAAAGAGVEGTRHVHFKEDVASAAPGAVVASITTASASPQAKVGVHLYAILGVHVNNIDRVNMRLHEQWIKELETNVKHGDVVGVLSGLNLSRDHGTHYAQERLLKECWRVAADVHLPLVLHLSAADAGSLADTVNRAAELLHELLAATTTTTAADAAAAPSALVLYDGLRVLHASAAMQQLVRTHRPDAAQPAAAAASSVPFYVLVTADGLSAATSAEAGEAAPGVPVEALAALLPPRVLPSASSAAGAAAAASSVVLLSQLLLGTGAPFGTPQNLPDPYLCTLPNEPGNYPYVVQTVFEAMRGAPADGAALHRDDLSAIAVVNHLRVFFGECITASADAAHDGSSSSRSSSDDEDAGDDEDEDGPRNRGDAAAEEAWAASQQPAAPTAVAGIADSAVKRDLERLLAAAAAERARVEEERCREEAQREQARTEELNEKRSRREKKKNVKANNRSNFTHFRNKDFAPRQSKQEKLAHQRELEGLAGGEGDGSGGGSSDSEDERDAGAAAATSAAAQRKATTAHSVSSSDSDGDSDAKAAPSSLAAEVERLLQAHAAHQDPARVAQPGGGRGKAKKKAAKAAAAAAANAGKESGNAGSAKKAGGRREDSDGSDDDDDGDTAAGATTSTAAQSSRRQRKRQQKRQQQLHHQAHRSDDDDD